MALDPLGLAVYPLRLSLVTLFVYLVIVLIYYITNQLVPQVILTTIYRRITSVAVPVHF